MLKRIIVTIFAAALFPLFLAWGAESKQAKADSAKDSAHAATVGSPAGHKAHPAVEKKMEKGAGEAASNVKPGGPDTARAEKHVGPAAGREQRSALDAKPGKEAHAPGDKQAMKDSSGAAKGKKSEAAAAVKMDTLTGEVVDIQCVMRDGQAKAADTTKAGAPVASAAAGTAAPEGAAIAAKPNEGKDKGWNSCGTEAVRRGAPVGIRTKDSKQIVLVVMDNRQPPGRTFGKQIGKTVSAVGHRYNENGLEVFEVAKVMPASGKND